MPTSMYVNIHHLALMATYDVEVHLHLLIWRSKICQLMPTSMYPSFSFDHLSNIVELTLNRVWHLLDIYFAFTQAKYMYISSKN